MTKTIAIVGLSDKPERYSYQVAKFLIGKGYRIIPVNPNIESVFGIKSYKNLLDIKEKIDVVDVFRRSEFVAKIVDEAIAIGAKAIWMQEGISDLQAAQKAKEAGLAVVENMCMMKEYGKKVPLCKKIY